jgi:thiamine pyrophosphate-dependent acetolactate synthase large subunit-like protein
MKRFECLQAIAPLVKDELFVTTAGGATAEWNAVRPSDGNIQVKTLGLCSSIGLGLAIGLPKRKVFVFDGDGALWMNLGSLATIGLHQPKNLIHICWDNKQYESSGGEPTVSTAGNIDFAGIARSAGIHSSRAVATVDDLKEAVSYALNHDGPHFICASIEAGRAEAPPLRYDELENKYRFIRYIEETEGTNILRVPMPASYKLK